MESLAYLDTHAVAWLYAGKTELFGAKARSILTSHTLRVSPMVTLELEYLREIGRLAEGPATVLPALYSSLGLTVCDRPFGEVARHAWAIAWTRDAFDRLITAQASLGNDYLVTKDATIAHNYPNVVWD